MDMGILLWNCNILSCLSSVESGRDKGPAARGNQRLQKLQGWLEPGLQLWRGILDLELSSSSGF